MNAMQQERSPPAKVPRLVDGSCHFVDACHKFCQRDREEQYVDLTQGLKCTEWLMDPQMTGETKLKQIHGVQILESEERIYSLPQIEVMYAI